MSYLQLPHPAARHSCVAFVLLLASASCSSLFARAPQKEEPKAPRFAIAAEVGTVGYGPAVVVTASKYFSATVAYTWFSYDYDFSDTDGDYNGKLKLSNFQAIANWH